MKIPMAQIVFATKLKHVTIMEPVMMLVPASVRQVSSVLTAFAMQQPLVMIMDLAMWPASASAKTSILATRAKSVHRHSLDIPTVRAFATLQHAIKMELAMPMDLAHASLDLPESIASNATTPSRDTPAVRGFVTLQRAIKTELAIKMDPAPVYKVMLGGAATDVPTPFRDIPLAPVFASNRHAMDTEVVP
jgi:hypothetical protein